MGGPSRESYLAAEASRKKRLAAMRTRDGVVDLEEWRAASQAARCIEGLLHEPPWLVGVRVIVAASAGFEIHVTLLWDEPAIRVCLPSSVNDVPVRVFARYPRRSVPVVSAPRVPSDP